MLGKNMEKHLILTGLDIISGDLSKHPQCPHGPTLLFTRKSDNKNFFACAACRDRKECSFFLWEDEHQIQSSTATPNNYGDKKRRQFLKVPEHRKLFQKLNQMKQENVRNRCYCHMCHCLFTVAEKCKHLDHDITCELSDAMISSPSILLKPRETNKKEAQYLFSESAVKTIISTLKKLKLRNIICIGAPRIHEYIQNNCIDEGFSSILLDIDERHRHFYGPLQFCWYNSFNNHFFEGASARSIFTDFLQTDNGCGLALITDPPFGGRVEPLADTIRTISELYQKLNSVDTMLPIMWIFPYFMEFQIVNRFADFNMLDYKVDYENHPSFTGKSKGRKHGSPVRIFTNISPSDFELPTSEGYKHCQLCFRWVYKENSHCNKCEACTSKDGTTYKHCDECERCIKSSWEHCSKCKRCCLPDHQCRLLEFSVTCFHCKQAGHKRAECPQLLVPVKNTKTPPLKRLNNKSAKKKQKKLLKIRNSS